MALLGSAGLFDKKRRASKRARKCYFEGGYAFRKRGSEWRKVSDEVWDTTVLSRTPVRVLGTRLINGSRVTVFSIKGRKGRYAANNLLFCA